MFEIQDVLMIGSLVFLEGVLSLDNAVILALMVKPLPLELRKRALTYGIAGAFVFRFVALFFIATIMKYAWIKALGGAYLLLIAVKYFIDAGSDENENLARASQPQLSFWRIVLMVEIMDICFSIDSILAAVAVSSKFTVVLVGGIAGIFMMRFAASMFGKLLDRLPWLSHVAYGLVAIVGLKLLFGALPESIRADFLVLVSR